MAHLLAQIGHESGSLRFSREVASGEAYEGRIDLGNRAERANYTAYSEATGIDCVEDPSGWRPTPRRPWTWPAGSGRLAA